MSNTEYLSGILLIIVICLKNQVLTGNVETMGYAVVASNRSVTSWSTERVGYVRNRMRCAALCQQRYLCTGFGWSANTCLLADIEVRHEVITSSAIGMEVSQGALFPSVGISPDFRVTWDTDNYGTRVYCTPFARSGRVLAIEMFYNRHLDSYIHVGLFTRMSTISACNGDYRMDTKLSLWPSWGYYQIILDSSSILEFSAGQYFGYTWGGGVGPLRFDESASGSPFCGSSYDITTGQTASCYGLNKRAYSIRLIVEYDK